MPPIHSCSSCSIPRILQEHTVPGVFSLHYLRTLPFGTKIETIVPGRCVTITSALNSTKIFVGGVEITRPDLFNNGIFVLHGLDGFVSHLSPLSCHIERMTPMSFPPPQTPERTQSLSQMSIMRLMLTDAMFRLRITGFSILALALKVKYAELVNLRNMTVFALDDASIFSGGHAYLSSVRFHIIPGRLLTAADLETLPVATELPTLEEGQKLVVTTTGRGSKPMRINYVRIRIPDVMHNLKIVVHGLFLPFPHVHPTAVGFGAFGADEESEIVGDGGISQVAPTPEIVLRAEIEDHHGL
ncbi:hypothetical protein L1049_005650 [Liquidambar formosana]|uniref:FAS1 domain-containing protein n=1 Tax=Liquidambar formosana TaxID=63359 RepID=A0AAP0REL1_LIQFO